MVTKKHRTSEVTDLQTKFGKVVRAWRRKLGITQEELAWRANLHRTYIADIERGARNVTLRSVENLANALELTVGHLISSAGDANEVGSLDDGISSDRSDHDGVRDILLIEDSADDAAMTARAFARARIANPLKVVRDAEHGLDYLFSAGQFSERNPVAPQLILLDLNLPQMSGLDFLRRIKSDERTHEIPVVVLTVSQSDQMIIECGRLGAENYIVKPVAIENLLRVTPKLNLPLTVGPPSSVPDHQPGPW